MKLLVAYLPSKDTEAQLPLRVLRLHGNHISEQGLACLVEYTRTDQCKLRELRYLGLHMRARRMSARLAHACLLCVCVSQLGRQSVGYIRELPAYCTFTTP